MSIPKLRAVTPVSDVSVERKTDIGSRDVELVFMSLRRYLYARKQPKLTLNFKVIESGPDFGKEIQGHYRLDRIDGRKRCFAGPKSRIVREFGRLFPDYKDSLPLPLSRLRNCTVVARVRRVTVDGNNAPIAKQQQYEVIDYIKERTNR